MKRYKIAKASNKMFDLYYEDKGQGKIIIFLPGLLASTRYWDEIVSELLKDFRVITVDQLGFGKSPKPDTKTNYLIEENILAYKKLFKKLNIERIDLLVGYSSSTVLATNLVLENSIINNTEDSRLQTENLLLITPPIFKSREEAIASLKKSSKTYKYLMYGPLKYFFIIFVLIFRPILRYLAPFMIRHVGKNSARDAFSFTWKSLYQSIDSLIINSNIARSLEKINIPVHILYAKDDEIVNEKNLLELAQKHENIKIQKVDSSHQIPLEQRDFVIQHIKSLIK